MGLSISKSALHLNPLNSSIFSGLSVYQSEFIKNYGSLSEPYKLVNPLGKRVFSFGWIYLICSFISIIVFGILNSKKNKSNEENKKNKNFLDYILSFLVLLSFLVFGISGLYLGIYWIIYKIEYFKWFGSLPLDARLKHSTISTAEKILKK